MSLCAQPSVLTWHNDNARTGQNLQETILTPSNVNQAAFGKLFTIAVDGKVDAETLYVPSLAIPGKGVHNVLFVQTEHDSSYAFDADTGSLLWQVSLLGASEVTSDPRSCGQVTPEIGITSTPVIDPASGPHGTLYAVATSKDSAGNYHQRLHALDVTTGAEEFSGPVEITASYPGTGDEGNGTNEVFDPAQHVERAALALSNGVIYTSWSSHCDNLPYTSWVIGFNESTLARVNTLDLTAGGAGGGIWQAGAGPAVDSSGNLFVLVGNGFVDEVENSQGLQSPGDYGNGFVKMSANGDTLAVADYFLMWNAIPESNADQDLGSGGPMLLPALNDAQGNPRSLAVGAGKDGNVYVVDQNNMGKFNMSSNQIYQQLNSVLGEVYDSPAWFNGSLYYASWNTTLRMYPFANGFFPSQPSSQTTTSFEFPGTTPSISANGTSNAIVWAAGNSTPAVLHAYDASNLANELYNSNQAPNGRDQFGAGNKFIVPMVVNGKVYVGTTNGVGVFGLLAAQTPATSVATITNAASASSGAIAPGEIITIKGVGLGPSSGVPFSVDPTTGMVDTTLANTSVSIGGVAAPILYASATQINAIVPYAIAGQSQTTVQVTYQGATSPNATVQVASAAPGIFTTASTGSGQAAAQNLNGTANGSANPAAPGSYVTLYFTGGGQTSPPGVTGSVNGTTLKDLAQQISVTVGGQPATVTFAGAAPLYVDGLNQLNIQLSNGTPAGAQPVVITIGGVSSPATATLDIL